jgi:uncharacterized protein (UPF0262 family)
MDIIDRIISYKYKLSDVEPSSIDEAILNFQRDLNPEKEVAIWEKITEDYLDECERNQNWTFTDKKRYFETVLKMSLGINV